MSPGAARRSARLLLYGSSVPAFDIIKANHVPDAGHSDQMPCKTGTEEDNMDEGMYPQPLDLCTYIERYRISPRRPRWAQNQRQRSYLVPPCLLQRSNTDLSFRRLRIGW